MTEINSPHASALTPAQVAEYREQGYLAFPAVFSPGEVTALLEAAVSPEIRRRQDEKGYLEQAVHLLSLTTLHPAFRALAGDARLVDRLKPLLGEDIQLQHSKIASKPPARGKGRFQMHQDFAYFPHTNTDLAAVIVYLDDATPANGCLQVWPGSHRRGLLNHLKDGYFSGGCIEPLPETEFVNLEMPAGSVSIHHCLTVHGSPPNTSGKPRRFIVFQYRADDAYQLADQVFPDTGLLVAGKRRGRVRCEPGVWELPRRKLGASPFGSAWNQIGEGVTL
ncbi:MAG: phytanoyl-CoA dioxygenase family protein [Lentisphaerae bacterium]|nr:phytanoyl-CoA dioxygenase family protein [Lentisphaerota bacterium]